MEVQDLACGSYGEMDCPGFHIQWEWCKNWASRPLQETVNESAVSKWPRCRWDIKHNQPTNQPTYMEVQTL